MVNFLFVMAMLIGLGQGFLRRQYYRASAFGKYGLEVNIHDCKQEAPKTTQYVCLSFFKFVNVSDPSIVAEKIKATLNKFEDVKGTLLVANEGINGQFALPTSLQHEFARSLANIDVVLDGISLNIGETIAYSEGDERFPFRKLAVRVKKRLLTDGLPDGAYDWNDSGPEITPEVWHSEVSRMSSDPPSSSSDEPSALLLDCRNSYESEMGTFKNAKPLGTSIFSESWTALDDILADVPRDTRILTFCTGGVRCVKTNAYLKQKLGFHNIGRLKDGIIGYERWRSESKRNTPKQHEELKNTDKNEDIDSSTDEGTVFTGKNFLFDRRRLGEEI
jgi:predicted sulfurtransferase